MLGLDSNVVVRYLAQDDVKQSGLATTLIEKTLRPDNPGYVSLVVVAEVVWVMVSCYSADRAAVTRVVEGLLSAPQLRVQEPEIVWKAVRNYRQSGGDFSDALIAVLGQVAGCHATKTFDQKALRHAGFELLR